MATTLLCFTITSITPHLHMLTLAVPSLETVGMVFRIFRGVPQKGQYTGGDVFMLPLLMIRSDRIRFCPKSTIFLCFRLYYIKHSCFVKGNFLTPFMFLQEGCIDRGKANMI